MHVWLNGRFILLDDAKISAFDAGFQHGVGLFETMLARNGRVFRIMDHMLRLRRSAEELRLTERLNLEPLADAVQLTIEKNQLEEARIRLTLTGGDLNLLSKPQDRRLRAARDPTILIHAQPPTDYPESFFEQGVTVTIADARLNPLNPFESHKTLNYWPRLYTLQSAGALGASEAIWFTVSNHLAGGSVSNVVLVKDGALFTPIARGEESDTPGTGQPLPSPVLPGITRDTIINLAQSAGISTHRKMLTYEDLSSADEVFLTNSSWGVLPVVRIEREPIAAATPGEITRRLRNDWLQRISAAADAEPESQSMWPESS